MTLLSTLLVIAAGLSLAVMVVLLTLAAHSAREARATIFPIVRDEELTRMRRARIGSVFSGVVAAVMAAAFFAAGQMPEVGSGVVASIDNAPVDQVISEAITGEKDGVEDPSVAVTTVAEDTETVHQTTPTPEPPVTVSPTAAPQASATPPPTATATNVPPSPTSGNSETAEATFTPTAVPATVTPPGTPSPAPAGVALGPIAFSSSIDEKSNAVDPTTTFSQNVPRIYAVFPVNGMENGMEWRKVWYFNGEEFLRDESVWEWGRAGKSYAFIASVGSGQYKLDIFMNDELMSSAAFSIEGPTAVGGPTSTETP